MLVKYNFFVDFRSVDSQLSITNSGLLNMFEDIACLHAQRLGEDISKSDLRWLLVGYRVDFVRRPKYGEEVEVTTWSRDYKNVTATREFELRSAEGELLVIGWSQWARVNIITKELVRLTDESMAAYESEPEHTNFGKVGRITEPSEHSGETQAFIDCRWMDNNRHMHNSYYLDLAETALPEQVLAQIADCDFDVVYKQEIPQNTTVRLLVSESADGWTVTMKSEDLSVLHAIVVYRKRAQKETAQQLPAQSSQEEQPTKRRSLFGRRK